MIHYVSVYDIKVDMSKHLNQLKAGDEVIITRHGVAVAKLVPYHTSKIRLGLLQGPEYQDVPDEAFQSTKEELAEWEGNPL